MALNETQVQKIEAAAAKGAVSIAESRARKSVFKKLLKFTFTDILTGAAGGAIGGALGGIKPIEEFTKHAGKNAVATFGSDMTIGNLVGKISEGGTDWVSGKTKQNQTNPYTLITPDITGKTKQPVSDPKFPTHASGRFLTQQRDANRKISDIEKSTEGLAKELAHQIDQLNRGLKDLNEWLPKLQNKKTCDNAARTAKELYHVYRKEMKARHIYDLFEAEYLRGEDIFEKMQKTLSDAHTELYKVLSTHHKGTFAQQQDRVKVSGQSKWSKTKVL